MRSSTARTVPGKTVADDRITARIPHDNRVLIERAAAIYGATLNQFVVQSALDRAGEILQREEILRLTERDARIFLDALENPPPPSAALLDALHAHSRLVKC